MGGREGPCCHVIIKSVRQCVYNHQCVNPSVYQCVYHSHLIRQHRKDSCEFLQHTHLERHPFVGLRGHVASQNLTAVCLTRWVEGRVDRREDRRRGRIEQLDS